MYAQIRSLPFPFPIVSRRTCRRPAPNFVDPLALDASPPRSPPPPPCSIAGEGQLGRLFVKKTLERSSSTRSMASGPAMVYDGLEGTMPERYCVWRSGPSASASPAPRKSGLKKSVEIQTSVRLVQSSSSASGHALEL